MGYSWAKVIFAKNRFFLPLSKEGFRFRESLEVWKLRSLKVGKLGSCWVEVGELES
jgi:hypothetical protein